MLCAQSSLSSYSHLLEFYAHLGNVIGNCGLGVDAIVIYQRPRLDGHVRKLRKMLFCVVVVCQSLSQVCEILVLLVDYERLQDPLAASASRNPPPDRVVTEAELP